MTDTEWNMIHIEHKCWPAGKRADPPSCCYMQEYWLGSLWGETDNSGQVRISNSWWPGHYPSGAMDGAVLAMTTSWNGVKEETTWR